MDTTPFAAGKWIANSIYMICARQKKMTTDTARLSSYRFVTHMLDSVPELDEKRLTDFSGRFISH
jgi:hypothetical protein